MDSVDIVISGGGVIGTAMALACERLQYRTLVLDLPSPEHKRGRKGFDLRALALSPQSLSWLTSLCGDEKLFGQRVDRMHISEQLGTSTIDFHREEVGADALAWIFEHEKLRSALRATCEQQRVHLETGTITAIDYSKKHLTLSNGKKVSCKLLVIAEGPNSTTRTLLGTRWLTQPLHQHAIVTVIATEQDHRATAWQRFGKGILAFLPLSDRYTYAIVWSVPSSLVPELARYSDEEFKDRLNLASNRMCGNVLDIDQRLSFPISQGLAHTFNPYAWIFILGDAAHTIHPLAGQGMNLGLEDTRALESILRVNQSAGIDWTPQLQALARRRRARAVIMQQLMARLDDTWKWQGPVVHWLRNFGVRTFSNIPCIKNQVIREAMGFGPITTIH